MENGVHGMSNIKTNTKVLDQQQKIVAEQR